MKTRTGFSVAVLAAAILFLLPVVPAALAQDQDQANYQDPPTRAGRIDFVQGSVSFQPGGQGDWVDAEMNRPLTTADNLWVDKDSRAEIEIGGTSIRLGPETSLTFLDLGDRVTQLRLSMGSLFFRVRHFGGDDAFEVDAPNLAFNVNQPGEYRLDVNQNGDQTIATVWHGAGEVTGSGDSYRLQAGQEGTFSGTDQLSYDVEAIGDQDDFGRWAMSRDQREDRARSREYVSDEMTGYEDLDDYGQWHQVEGYGNVWSPQGVPGDWAPYRYGSWAYVSPWGWTWVEQEPWGFAPFHYGRWAYLGSSWCWVPGPVAVAPVYSPALVAFVGGGGFSFGVGIGGGGGVGWFPLAPGEVFVPWYRTSPRYVESVNITNTRVNVTQVTNVYNNVTVNHVTNITYVNQRVNNSVTVVNHDTFVNARPVHNNLVQVDQRQMASAPVTHEVARNIQPARESFAGAGRPAQQKPPEQAMSRPVVATRQPVAINRPAAPGMQRTVAPPPVRTVKATPPTAAQPLERGARGGANPPAPNNAGSRPGQPANRPGPPNNQPPQPENNRPGAMNNSVPRPGAPENAPAPPVNNRPGADNNRAVPRPGAPETTPRPNAPENNRPGAADNNRPPAPENRPAPPDNNRPGAENNRVIPRPGAPETTPRPNPPENNRPGAADNNRPPAPENRPPQPENNRPSGEVPRPPSANRPEQTPEQPRGNPNARPENPGPNNARPETPRNQPEQPARPPETRQPNNPPPNQPEAAPRNENRPQQPPPPSRQEGAPTNESRPPSAPRPETRPSEPPPQRESRQPEQQNQKPEKPSKEDKNKEKPPQFH